MKPTTIVMNYVALIQSSVISIDEVPTYIKADVEKWLAFFKNGKVGGEDNGLAN
ncbi:hypothetical protein QP343_05785 [Lactobacillus jensenii]|jgi:hypothetical protein|uniref:XkdX family protein n=1 Tax=Lactobacillus jensenii TaxID=109790 RepID=A0ABU9FK05_LACJE|nr:hypothetical protein [Lactobacillus jensenii]MBS5831861.1 hypothetical protein [Lactobacillus jensenii]MCF1850653.1 hypothetical protein [Lactobacillus jensenii]MCW8070836.1 hypothetical protein [Lactobacillus jensenii]MCW8115903.1 hypothetical protein [Lactobacillus jensenii]MDK6782940.1 hypothetical protein [Lactobacillus jensenii]